MSNKEKIAELQDLINRSFDKFNSVVTGAREELDDLINSTHAEIVKLKKEDEVKPVFPRVGVTIDEHGDISIIKDMSKESILMGNSFYLTCDAENDIRRRKARAYVIEAINKANGGDNGFKAGELNYIVTIPVCGSSDFEIDSYNEHQNTEAALYFRSEVAARKYCHSMEFMRNYHSMLGIK